MKKYHLIKYKFLANQKVKSFKKALQDNDPNKAYQIFSQGSFFPEFTKSFNNISKDYSKYLIPKFVNIKNNKKSLYNHYIDKFLELTIQYNHPNLLNALLISTIDLSIDKEPNQRPPNHGEFILAQKTAFELVYKQITKHDFNFVKQTYFFDTTSYHNIFEAKTIYKGIDGLFLKYCLEENYPDSIIIDFFIDQYPKQIYQAARDIILEENRHIISENKKVLLELKKQQQTLIQSLYKKHILNQQNYSEFLFRLKTDYNGNISCILDNQNSDHQWLILKLFFQDNAKEARKYIKENILDNLELIELLNTKIETGKEYSYLKNLIEIKVLKNTTTTKKKTNIAIL